MVTLFTVSGLAPLSRMSRTISALLQLIAIPKAPSGIKKRDRRRKRIRIYHEVMLELYQLLLLCRRWFLSRGEVEPSRCYYKKLPSPAGYTHSSRKSKRMHINGRHRNKIKEILFVYHTLSNVSMLAPLARRSRTIF